jgi:hypothetical protein
MSIPEVSGFENQPFHDSAQLSGLELQAEIKGSVLLHSFALSTAIS